MTNEALDPGLAEWWAIIFAWGVVLFAAVLMAGGRPEIRP